jgi:hypothetical protein
MFTFARFFLEALHLRCAHLSGGRNFSFRAFCGAIGPRWESSAEAKIGESMVLLKPV